MVRENIEMVFARDLLRAALYGSRDYRDLAHHRKNLITGARVEDIVWIRKLK